MNPITILLLAMLAIVALVIALRANAREECHNAAKPEPDPAVPDGPPTVEAKAIAEIAAMKPTPAPKGMAEAEISAKVQAGLTRAQAIEVIARQAEHDAALAKAEKKAK